MTEGDPTAPWPPLRERSLVPVVTEFLTRQGFRVWADPDGSDYFDLVARRGDEVGLVELKLTDWTTVIHQALRRRGWGDWVAVAVPRRSLANRIVARSRARRSESVGVWCVERDSVTVLRPAKPFPEMKPDPFRPLREHLRESLDLLEQGILPAGTGWRSVRLPQPRPGRPGTLSTALWRLEEFASGPELNDPAEEAEPVRKGKAGTTARTAPPSS